MASRIEAGGAGSGAHTGILFGQIAVVTGVALSGVWAATQWTAHALGYQPRLGAALFDAAGVPVYECWRRFKSDQACRLNFDQGPAPGFLMPGCG